MPKTGVRVRQSEPGDAGPVSQLILNNLYQVLINDYSSDVVETLAPFYTPEKIVERAEQQLSLVATEGGTVVGTASLDHDRVRNVFVDVDLHGQGVGRELMAALEADAQARGVAKLYLMSGISAYGFYARLGYTIVEHIVRDLNGVSIAEMRMEKQLGTS